MTVNKSKPLALMGAVLLLGTMSYAQSIESITFSAVASSNDNFQPVMGTPYGASLSGANGSIEISAAYGEGTYDETTLSTEELKLQSSIRVYPNPTSYQVNVDLTPLPNGIYQLYLVDFSGKTVYTELTEAKAIQLDMSNYSAGTYVLQVQTRNTQKVETYKIVKK